MKGILAAANIIVPAFLVLEQLGFTVTVDEGAEVSRVRARRGDEEFVADDPITILGLVKLIESRTWDWKPTDEEIDQTIKRYNLGG